MSRVGRLPVKLPDGVKVTVAKNQMEVEGPKGKLSQQTNDLITIDIKESEVVFDRADETKKAKSMHGLYRKLLSNMVHGVKHGFTKVLVINGVGYRAELQGTNLFLNLGYSNPIIYPAPEGITFQVEGNNKITVSGINKEQVGQVASEIRSIRPPEPYKGKGVRYEEERIVSKVGKSGVK